MAAFIRAGEDLSFLDQAGFQPMQKRVSAQTIEDYRGGVRSGQPFWEEPDYAFDPIEVSTSGAIKDGHHRLAAVLLEDIFLFRSRRGLYELSLRTRFYSPRGLGGTSSLIHERGADGWDISWQLPGRSGGCDHKYPARVYFVDPYGGEWR